MGSMGFVGRRRREMNRPAALLESNGPHGALDERYGFFQGLAVGVIGKGLAVFGGIA